MCRCRYRPGFSRLPRVSESPIFIKGTFVATSSKARTDGAKTKLLPSRQPLLSARAQRGLHTARCSRPAPHHPLSSCQNLPQLSLGLTCASFSAPRHNNNHKHPPPPPPPPAPSTQPRREPAEPPRGRSPPPPARCPQPGPGGASPAAPRAPRRGSPRGRRRRRSPAGGAATAAGVVGGEHHAAGAGQPAHAAIPSAGARAERGGSARLGTAGQGRPRQRLLRPAAAGPLLRHHRHRRHHRRSGCSHGTPWLPTWRCAAGSAQDSGQPGCLSCCPQTPVRIALLPLGNGLAAVLVYIAFPLLFCSCPARSWVAEKLSAGLREVLWCI